MSKSLAEVKCTLWYIYFVLLCCVLCAHRAVWSTCWMHHHILSSVAAAVNCTGCCKSWTCCNIISLFRPEFSSDYTCNTTEIHIYTSAISLALAQNWPVGLMSDLKCSWGNWKQREWTVMNTGTTLEEGVSVLYLTLAGEWECDPVTENSCVCQGTSLHSPFLNLYCKWGPQDSEDEIIQ